MPFDIIQTRDQITAPWVEIGEFTYGLPQIIGGGEGSKLVIGRFCSIADGVELELGTDHNIDRISSYPFDNLNAWAPGDLELYHRPNEIYIGNDVWLGSGSKVLHGITVGDGAVIGAFAVVSKDVRPYAVVVGNPAKEIRRRFDDESVERLLELRWWDWPEEKIRKNLPALVSCDPTILEGS